MSQSCSSDCSCCVEGQCTLSIACSKTALALVVVVAIVGGLIFIVLVYCAVTRYIKWRKHLRTNRIGIQASISSRNRVPASSPQRSAIRNYQPSGNSNRDEEYGDLSLSSYKIVRAFPDKEIPTSVEYTDMPEVVYRISASDPIVVIAGDKPTGKPKYLSDSVKSLVKSKGKVDGFKSVVLKPSTSLKASGKVAKRIIVEEVDQNDVSNMSLVENIERESRDYKQHRP